MTKLQKLGLFVAISSALSAPALAAPTELLLTVKAPPLTSPGQKLYVTGNSDTLCNWEPRCVELTEIGHGVFQATLSFASPPSTLEFKITRGSWETEATDASGQILPNFSYILKSPKEEYVVNLLGWKDQGASTATGKLEIIPGFLSTELGNTRTIRVLLPPSYDSSPEKRYPVIYMHDGQNLFDPKTSGSGVEWNVDEILYRMNRQGQAREAIVVGVDCTDQRNDEYDYSRKGELYAGFLIHSLKPWIDSRYRTLTDRDSTYSMGSSMGALISLSLIWRHSDVFSKAGAISLPAHAHSNAAFKLVDSTPVPPLPVYLYMDYGDYANDADYVGPGREFVQHLMGAGFPESRLNHQEFHYADHFEADWARRLDIPLAWILQSH